jgi:hypothetical protein
LKPSTGKLPRLAWFSTLPIESSPAASRSAYVTKQLLPLLRSKFEIELFHDKFTGFQDYPTFHYLSAFERHESTPYDLFFYQLEDHPSSAFVRMHLGLKPGLVWFHDLLFSTRPPEALLHSSWEHVIERLAGQSSEWPNKELWPDYTTPVDRRAAALALIPAFSNPWAHGEFLRSCTQGISSLQGEIPASFYLPLPIEKAGAELMRHSSILTIGFQGSTQIEDRAHTLLQAISETKRKCRLIWLLDEAERRNAEELGKEFGVTDIEFVIGRSPESWSRIVPKLHLAIHNRFSVFGSLSPYLQISLTAGVSATTIRFGEAECLPSSATFQIEAGDFEVGQLRDIITKVKLEDKASLVGQQYAVETFTPELIANELERLIEISISRAARFAPKWSAVEQSARDWVINGINQEGLERCRGTPWNGDRNNLLKDLFD